jgi:hypothetical protein
MYKYNIGFLKRFLVASPHWGRAAINASERVHVSRFCIIEEFFYFACTLQNVFYVRKSEGCRVGRDMQGGEVGVDYIEKRAAFVGGYLSMNCKADELFLQWQSVFVPHFSGGVGHSDRVNSHVTFKTSVHDVEVSDEFFAFS